MQSETNTTDVFEPAVSNKSEVSDKDKEPKHLEWEALNQKALKAHEKGQYKEGLTYAQKAFEFAKTNFEPNHPNILNSMNNLAFLYSSQGRYGEAEPLYKKALQLRETVQGKKHPDTISSLNNLAGLYSSQGRYGEAEPLYNKALQLFETVQGKKHPDTITSLNGLATLYFSQGRYGEAEPLYKKALQLRETVQGKKHPDTITSLNNLAFLYYSQGRYEEAVPLYKEALQLRETALGKKHPDTITSLNNLALLYHKQGRYREAEPLYKEALQLRETVLGKKHPDTITSLNNLGGLYSSQGRLRETEPLYKEALQLRETVLGKKHPDTITSLNNLAALYNSQGRYEKVEPLLKEALQLSENILGKIHPNTISLISNLFLQYANPKVKKLHDAYALLKRLELRLLSRSAQELVSTQSGRVRRLYLKNISGLYDFAFSFAIHYPSPEHTKFAANVLLRSKQIQAEEAAFQQRLLQISKDPVIMDLKHQIAQHRKNLRQSLLQKNPQSNPKLLLEKLIIAESLMRKKARQIHPDLKVLAANIDQVIEKLPDHSALIEYRFFSLVDFNTAKTTSTHLAAYVMLSDYSAKERILFADIGKLEDIAMPWQLWQLLDQPLSQEMKQQIEKMINQELTPVTKAFAIHKLTHNIYQKLIHPFEPQLSNVKTLYIAPDNFLNLIPFSRLITNIDDMNFLVKRYQINRIQTGRDLLRKSSMSPSSKLVVMGGITYDNDQQAVLASIPEQHKALIRQLNPNQRAESQLEQMTYLPHSKTEASKIAELFKLNRKNGEVACYYGKDAREYVLKHLKQAPEILHLSTHGFYLKPDEKSRQLEDEETMMLSGLALSGANMGINGLVDSDGNDGILYSIEASGLNLQGTKLVSLSACSTGKGVVDYSEGVYGLVRAFRTAGAESILMTLWPVGDQSSKDFMTHFYDYYLGSLDPLTPGEALHKTRLDFMKHDNKAYRNPRVWAPYVIVGK